MKKYDFIVLGGGPAGYTAALVAAKAGKKTAIVEKDNMGGTCLNRGCIPTKTLLESSKRYEEFRELDAFGIEYTGEVNLNCEILYNRKKNVIETLRNGLIAMIQASKIEIYKASGQIIPGKKVKIQYDGKEETLEAEKILIATGSSEAELNIDGRQYLMGSTVALELENIPKEVVVIGGGVVGMEFATFYHEIGCKVIILEALPDLLYKVDKEIVKKLVVSMSAKGIAFSTNSIVKSIKKDDDKFTVFYEKDGNNQFVKADLVMCATGRKPNTVGIGLEECQIVTNEKGYIVVNDNMETNIPGIYAAGDVIGGTLLAHVAFKEGTIAARHAFSLKEGSKGKYVVPSCIYTHPEIASVGLTEEEAKEKGIKIVKGYSYIMANGRALAAGNTEGFAKIIAEQELGQIIGVHVIGENSTEILGSAVYAVEGEFTTEEMAEFIIAHPTVNEILKDAAADCQTKLERRK